ETSEPVVTVQNEPRPPAPLTPETASWQSLRTWTLDLVVCVVVLFLIGVFLYQPVKVEGGSMEPGLEDQGHIFINKMVYRFESIERGDIVVFRYPRDTRKSFVKRVIGLPGDRIRILSGRVYVNGVPLQEPYVPDEYQDARSYSDTVVPNNAYFVLGDHRSMSND